MMFYLYKLGLPCMLQLKAIYRGVARGCGGGRISLVLEPTIMSSNPMYLIEYGIK